MSRLPPLPATPHPNAPAQQAPYWWTRAAHWFLGVEPDPPVPARREPANEAAAPSKQPEVRVSAPEPASWAEAFRRAVTDASAVFVQRYVDPYHQEDPSIGFAVRRLRVGLNESAAACLREFQAMPQTMRDGIAKIRVQKAKGAEQLQMDDFYGISFCATETLVDGQLVETLMYAGGARAALSFQFEGDYVTLPARVPPATSVDDSAIATPVNVPHNPRYQTPMQSSTAMSNLAPDPYKTPMQTTSKPVRQPVARAELRANGQSTVVDLFADGFPYTVGTHADLQGYCICDKAADTNAPALLPSTIAHESRSYTSRQHLVLKKFDDMQGEIEVNNLAHCKNGTLDGATVLGPRFVYSTQRAPWLGLGGPVGSANGRYLEMRVVRA